MCAIFAEQRVGNCIVRGIEGVGVVTHPGAPVALSAQLVSGRLHAVLHLKRV